MSDQKRNKAPHEILDRPAERDGVQAKSLRDAVRQVQAYFTSLAPASEVWSEELLAERRSEVERD